MSALTALVNRPEQQNIWTRLWKYPVNTIAQSVYNILAAVIPSPRIPEIPVRVVCVSDTHNNTISLPDGDILIHAGDLSQSGSLKELQDQIDWLDEQPHAYKIVIAGNHDRCLDPEFACRDEKSVFGVYTGPEGLDWKSLIYLYDSTTTVKVAGDRELKLFGAPHTPKHGNWAFQYDRSDRQFWTNTSMPGDTDILITHGPPRAHLDLGRLGCPLLLSYLWSINRRPMLHVFGHVHGGYGVETVVWDEFQRTYEMVMSRDQGIMGLVMMLRCGIRRIAAFISGANRRGQTIMVNAAIVGGVRDEKRREAISVDI
ncbi:Metallo-dependent phosphatase-like protein [Aspergillus californicus]